MGARILLLLAGLLLPGLAAAGPKIQHWTLKNGARVYFVEARALPMLQLRAVFDAGAGRDAPGRSGTAALVSSMLNEGTGALDADAIALRFEGLGAEFGAGSERDMAFADLRSLSDSRLLEPAVDLMADILAAPSFPPASLERERASFLVGLQKEAQSPGATAEKAFYRLLYGAHPYARHPAGDAAGLKAITRADLMEHHRRYYTGANALLAIVGDVSRAQAGRIAERLLGRLPAGAAAPALPRAAPGPARVERITFPAQQTHLRLGLPVLTRTDPDYFPLYVGNYILGGGGLVSRLADEVREKRGLAYSVYSYFLPLRVEGPFVLGLQTKNSQRAQALRLVRRVVADFVAHGPTEQEVEAAKRHLTGGFPLRIDSNRKIADNLAVIGFYGLPLTYLDDFIARIEAVTAAQIRDAFRRRVPPERMVTVIVGG